MAGVDRYGEQLPEEVAIWLVVVAVPRRLFDVGGFEEWIEV
ncbi:MAG TPA: hypothetical protein VIL92_00225 [Gaiellaceae bacterium]